MKSKGKLKHKRNAEKSELNRSIFKKILEQYTGELYRRDERMTDSFKEEMFEEEPIILESEVKTAQRATRRNRSCGEPQR